ncbi:hypothetical protein DOY81_000925 [Sarcophaga bullata]|nr:hypothetical protein DOY81_000925 [Sarcophaga bullata]
MDFNKQNTQTKRNFDNATNHIEYVTPKEHTTTVTFGNKGKVEAEIYNLVRLGVLDPVDFCEWGTAIVAIIKKDGGYCCKV